MSDTPDLPPAAELHGDHRIRELEGVLRLAVAGWADAERRAGTVFHAWIPPAWVPRWAWPTDERVGRLRAPDEFIDGYEASNGAITESELRRLRSEPRVPAVEAGRDLTVALSRDARREAYTRLPAHRER